MHNPHDETTRQSPALHEARRLGYQSPTEADRLATALERELTSHPEQATALVRSIARSLHVGASQCHLDFAIRAYAEGQMTRGHLLIDFLIATEFTSIEKLIALAPFGFLVEFKTGIRGMSAGMTWLCSARGEVPFSPGVVAACAAWCTLQKTNASAKSEPASGHE